MILLCIALSILAPPVFHPVIDHGQAEIGTLDVCHPAIQSLSSGGEAAWMTELGSRHLPLAESRNAVIAAAPLKSPLLSSQDEHPPEV